MLLQQIPQDFEKSLIKTKMFENVHDVMDDYKYVKLISVLKCMTDTNHYNYLPNFLNGI
jgi:hypothetical protein